MVLEPSSELGSASCSLPRGFESRRLRVHHGYHVHHVGALRTSQPLNVDFSPLMSLGDPLPSRNPP